MLWHDNVIHYVDCRLATSKHLPHHITILVGYCYCCPQVYKDDNIDRIVHDIDKATMGRADRRRERHELHAALQDHKPAVLEASRRLQSAMSMPKANNVPCENQVSGRLEEVVAPQGGSASRDVLISTPGMPAKVLTTM